MKRRRIEQEIVLCKRGINRIKKCLCRSDVRSEGTLIKKVVIEWDRCIVKWCGRKVGIVVRRIRLTIILRLSVEMATKAVRLKKSIAAAGRTSSGAGVQQTILRMLLRP